MFCHQMVFQGDMLLCQGSHSSMFFKEIRLQAFSQIAKVVTLSTLSPLTKFHTITTQWA